MTTDLSRRWKSVLTNRYGTTMGAALVDEMVANLVSVHAQFMGSGCADTQFEKNLNSSDEKIHAQRLGEMLLFDRLTHAGFELKSKDVGPDFRAEKDGEVVWLELITPSFGDDEKIPDLVNSHIPLSPSAENTVELSKRLLLRITASIKEKREKFEKYRTKMIVGKNEPCVIVINDALLCPDCHFYGVSHGADFGEGGRPLIEHATLGIGPAIWMPDVSPGKFKLVQTFLDSVPTMKPEEDHKPQALVPVNIFNQVPYDASTANISGVMQVTLREDYGFLMKLRSMAETTKPETITLLYPGSFAQNENATSRLSLSLKRHLMRIVNLPSITTTETENKNHSNL